jgi:hypothetical protein
MSLNSRQRSLISTIGKAGLHALFPKDFEHYFFSLELVDSNGRTVDYFSFPILPSSFSEEHSEITNIKKSMGGVVAIKNQTFVPKQINIRGDFGKKIKILLGGKIIELFGLKFSIKNGNFGVEGNPLGNLKRKHVQFSSFAKTGYGCVKIIEAMKDKSLQVDPITQKPYSLYCYNSMTGNNYQVEIKRFTHSQDKSSFNMIPSYNLSMVATATLDSLVDYSPFSSVKNLGIGLLQRTTNNVVNRITYGLNNDGK